ncbi:MAG: PD-(D/E)XK nuclease family protein [Bacillota bacterium]
MNRLILELEKVCKTYLLEEKILVVPTYLAGYELRNALANWSQGWINLLPSTVSGLAFDLAAPRMADKGCSFLNREGATQVVEGILAGLIADGELDYFSGHRKLTGLVSALTSFIFELRYCGIKAADLKEPQFVAAAKARDLTKILRCYEEHLEKNRLVDSPGQIEMAIEILADRNLADNRIYLIPAFLELSPLEERLLECISGGRLIRLEADTGWDENLVLPDTGEVTVELYHAYGLVNETREVLRRINSENIPLDRVTVAYSSSEYIPVFWSLAREMGFNLTVFEGIPAAMTRPGRVLLGLIEWIRQDFAVSQLISLLRECDIKWSGPDGLEISGSTAERLLNRAGIGWGRERYARMQDLAEGLKLRALEREHQDIGDDDCDYLGQSRLAGKLHSILDDLLQAIPEPDIEGRVALNRLGRGLASLVKNLSPSRNEFDEAALTGIVARLEQWDSALAVILNDALERVENLVCSMRVGRSTTRPGCLHLVDYRDLIWSGRPVTFVVGLDAGRFPGRGTQDPVLLDSERRLLHPGLKQGAGRPKNNQKLMELGLRSRQGRVTMSCSSFDLIENRSLYPAFLVLKAFRQLRGDGSLDYSVLVRALGEPVGFASRSGHALDEGEWWLTSAIARQAEVMPLILVTFPGLHNGITAHKARMADELSEYDGKVEVEAADYDPRLTGAVLSCSMIEHLAQCPFSYFLRYILNVKPPEGIEYDPDRWLQASDRGSLLHALYCSFMRDIVQKGEKVDMAVHSPVLRQMAEEMIEYYRQEIPPPNEMVFELEVRDILESCDLFLKGQEVFAEYRPLYFEVPFGLGPELIGDAGCGLPGPVEIELSPGEKIRLRGVIDRIDQKADGTFAVWDYKTGSSRKYAEHRYLYRGRQVQHALYSMAAEKILTALGIPDPRVLEAGYYFPTEQGEGRRVIRRQDQRTLAIKALKHLFDLLKTGVFPATEDEEPCGFCDYIEVCGGHAASSQIKAILATENALEPWRRLMEIG